MAAKYPVPTKDQFLSISCINVGVGPGGTTSMLARVSIVNYTGDIVLDTYVAPTMPVTDYRTATTGISAEHLNSGTALAFNTIQQHVAHKIKGKVIVGHSLWNDLSVLGIPHPAVATRDVALYVPFRNALSSPNQIIGLQTLMWHLMSRRIQDQQQNPVSASRRASYGDHRHTYFQNADSNPRPPPQLENARAALDLYRSHSTEWESAVSNGNWPSALPPSTFSRCYL